MTTLLLADSLCKSYDGTTVVCELSLKLTKGEILCLLGPSGSGKTTLLRLLAGLEQPDSGQLLFEGRDIAATPPHKRNFGMMFQEYALFPHKNVADNIGFGLEMAKWSTEQRQQRIREMLSLVGLEGKEKRCIDELSGGERQRVALARSLAPGPRLLLLDEPLGSLDRVLRDRLAGEIRAILKSQGVTAVFVTHDQAEAFAVADTIAILRQGCLEQCAAPEVVYRRPKTAAVAAFLGFRNLIDCTRYPLTTVFSQLPPDLQAYTKILLLRPEGARIQNRENTHNRPVELRGRVAKRQFQGQVYAMDIQVNNLLLHFDLPIDPAPPQIGREITLNINPSSMIQLLEQTG